MPRARILAPLLLLVAALVPSLATAQEGPVTRYVHGQYDALTTELRGTAGAARDERITTILDGLLDFEAMSRAALGTNWDTMTEAQRTEFVALLRQLTRNQYLHSITDVLDYEVTWEAEAEVSGGTMVTMSASSRTERRAEPFRISYSMHNVGGNWRAFDITTEGVSTVTSYRRQFRNIIGEHGIEGLLQRMRDRRDRETH